MLPLRASKTRPVDNDVLDALTRYADWRNTYSEQILVYPRLQLSGIMSNVQDLKSRAHLVVSRWHICPGRRS